MKKFIIKLNAQLRNFFDFHTGTANKLLHMIGFALVGLGFIKKSLFFVISGAIVQELGHFYEYARTKDPKANPLNGLKPQLVFAYPLLILIILYVLLAK